MEHLFKHRRSPEKLLERATRSAQRKAAKHYLFNNAYHDPIHAETVSTVTQEAIVTFVGTEFQNQTVFYNCWGVVERGEVLSDSRGKGSMQ